jgi:hypothetical protein
MVILPGGSCVRSMPATDSFEHFEPGIPDPFVVLRLPGLIRINAVYRER